jgi:hypothetical protein
MVAGLLSLVTVVSLSTAGPDLPAPGQRFNAAGIQAQRVYRATSTGQQYFFPASFKQLRWPLRLAVAASTATLLVKPSDRPWTEAQVFDAVPDRDERGDLVSLALPPGIWDLGILVPGNQPSFALSTVVSDQDIVLPEAKLEPSARLRASIVDASSRRSLESWKVYLRRSDPATTPEFLSQRPIAQGPALLDFTSLPTGDSWEIDVVPAAPYVSHTFPLGSVKPRTTVDLRAISLEIGGSVDVEIASHRYLPPGPIVVSIKSSARDAIVGSNSFDPSDVMRTHFGPLSPGDYEVRVDSVAAALHRAEQATIRPTMTTPVHISLDPIVLAGQVRRGLLDVPDATIEARGPNGVRLHTTSDKGGHFELPIWAAGRYAITAVGPSAGLRTVRLVDAADDQSFVPLDLALEPGILWGLVSDDSTDSPIEGASVQVTREDSPNHEATSTKTGPDGSFAVDGLGIGRVKVSASAQGYQTQTVTSVSTDDDGRELNITLKRGVTVHGTVVDSLGAPVEGATVLLDCCSAGEPGAETQTSSDGGFDFDGVGDGAHLVVASACGHALAFASVSNLDHDVAVVLPPWEGRFDLVLRDRFGKAVDPSGLELDTAGVRFPLNVLRSLQTSCDGAASRESAIALGLVPYGPTLMFDKHGALVGSFNHLSPDDHWQLVLAQP